MHRAIISGIDAHRRGETAEDPLTGALLEPPRERGVDEKTGWFLDHFSKGELRRYLASGPRPLAVRAGLEVALAVALLSLGTGIALRSVGDLATEPGIGTILAVVLAGCGLTATLFHAIRLRAALRLGREPVRSEVVKAHLELTQRLAPDRGAARA